MLIKIAPSILSADFSKLGEEVLRIERAGADLVHVDVMDGHFVPNITIGPPVVKSLKKVSKLPFDVHLMIENPDMYIESFADAGADIISVHAEACCHLHRTIQKIKLLGKKAAVALNPATSLCAVEWVLDDVDMVLLMSVNPGFGGQKYISGVTRKIEELKKIIDNRGLDIDIEVDGGIDTTNIHSVTKAGANVIVSGSTIFAAEDTAKIIQELKINSYSE
ncbi:ribulose-phosphate 3-epimerase [Acetivibrio mesophilus]|uniref:Ribulose-phosphate 3-epimerase n=1 Tax=Acetivibrio mesophilus TaxID=2487273 RepID=A0A4Q0I707_9FIRM|nr:ribulose-phosphate 3-epimerase [Acetivibrio mesophilus]RXE60184.1 ribulose-phosphate 3-epimerase [Acetivibrio mesophilus]HHV29056.1 ribulose-phosphate 3-epimerase [Clostridium sp.]